MRDAQWVAHEKTTGHTDRMDTLVPEGWMCRGDGGRCKAKSDGPLTMGDVRDVRLTTTEELLLELRTRAHNWRVVEPRARWFGAVIDDIQGALTEETLNGTREP